ncbi:hypothetical protein PaG_04800 [Moesziomyces aphidis]|uniref:CAF1B/HIR1 beta-propeller domain-containing protein n=1 Tax=Moesziomyces aphidis TaxID=84754 RepID=W3VJF7_MOEAP|nr:hypothetical protein PaG_04800 [Moesziomyces aphidis]
MLATLFRHGRAIRRLDSLNSSPSAVLNNIKLSRSCAGAEPALAAKGSQKQSKAKACMRIRSQCVTLATNEFALSTVTSAKSLQRGTIRPSPREERVTKAGAAPTTPPCCRSPLCTEFFHCEVATLRNALVQTTKPFSSVASRCANPRLPLARLTRRGKTAGSSVTQISHFHRPTVHFAPLSRSLSLSPALGVEAIFPRASQPASSLSAWNIRAARPTRSPSRIAYAALAASAHSARADDDDTAAWHHPRCGFLRHRLALRSHSNQRAQPDDQNPPPAEASQQVTMVRSVTFEIRWHDTQPIYSCSFQPIPANHLRRVLDHNMGQAAGMAPGKGLSELDSSAAAAMTSTSSSHASASTSAASSSKLAHPPVMAGGQSWRLATAGGDNNARVWMVHPNIPSPAAIASAAAVSGSTVVAPHPPRVEYLATLQRHSGVVNVVRFCPKGELLATAGDDGNVLFWVPSDRSKPSFGDVSTNLEGETQFEKEFWRVKLMCRATQQELYDMAWSPNGETLAVGGTDFVARIINVQDGHVIREISEHNHYVQGIAWDPLNEFIATQSSDRSVHVHNLQTRRHGDHAHGHATGTDGVASSQLVSKNAKLDLHRRNGSSGGLPAAASAASAAAAAAAHDHMLPVPAGLASSDAGRRGSSVSRSGSRTRSIRSPSPIPPLPAIRAPPSPKQRMQAAAASGLGGPLAKASMRLYGDENFSGFFRRLSFSPDGGLLVTPSGLFDPPPPPASPTVSLSPRKSPATLNPATVAGGAQPAPTAGAQTGGANKSAVYLYARGNLTRSNAPIAVLPGHKTATLVVRFSPILYELRRTPRAGSGAAAGDDEGIAPHPTIPLEAGKQKTVSLRTEAAMAGSPPPSGVSGAGKASPPVSRQDARSPPRGISVIGLPYRMVYAVATQDSVWIYDTQQTGPICCFSNMHYASFTDLSWSPDGQTLMMSSTDGYCSVVVFDYAELGVPYAFAAQPALKAPAPGVPAPAHIAEGKTTGSAPSTPKITSPAQLVSVPVQAAGSAAEAYASAIGGTATATTSAPAVASGAGLGLAIPSAAGADTGADEAPKKKRRIALTLERPLGS